MISHDLVNGLLAWYRAVRRDLPWRQNPEPWRVLVAETMLQQTRVATVLPRYEAFLTRFPDPATLARADEEEVLALWSGLGYYRRARNLHAAARLIQDDHGGRVPDDPDTLRALPGVGAYTAGAVLSVAFGLPEPIIDGNVERVFSRLLLIRGNVKRGAARKALWSAAREIVRLGPPADVNQALMELGALVCVPGRPRCDGCALTTLCAARAAGLEEELPELPEKRPTESVTLAMGLVRRGSRVLLTRAPEGGFLAGTWCPPFAVVSEDEDAGDALRASCREQHGFDLVPGAALGLVRHTITHHKIEARCFAARAGNDTGDARFVGEDEIGNYGVSSLAKKSLLLHME